MDIELRMKRFLCRTKLRYLRVNRMSGVHRRNGWREKEIEVV